jgi:hypothetical protein
LEIPNPHIRMQIIKIFQIVCFFDTINHHTQKMT